MYSVLYHKFLSYASLVFLLYNNFVSIIKLYCYDNMII